MTNEATSLHAADPAPRRSRTRLYVAVAVGLVVLVGLLVVVKGAQIGKLIAFGKEAQKAGPPPEAVGTFTARKETWEETLSSVGSVTSARGVTISNDAAGIVSKISFESGAMAKQGQILVELDARVERAQLASAIARQRLAGTTAARTRALVSSGALSPAQKDTDESQLSASTADVGALEAQIERKVVRAPFAGKLGIRMVNVGQFLAPGTPITVLESDEATFVDFTLPQQTLSKIAVGMSVRYTLDPSSASGANDSSPSTEARGEKSPTPTLTPTPGPADAGADPAAAHVANGAIYAIEPVLDPTTRTFKVRASVPADATWLQPGSFLNVSVIRPEKRDVVAVPETAIVHASYGDSVFVVEDGTTPSGEKTKVAHQKFVRLGPTRGDFVAVVEGLDAGQEVVTAGAFKLHNNARVTVNNAVQAKPDLAPRPVNR